MIHLDSERNIELKSNNNVWFFEIKDQTEEKKIVERKVVNIDQEGVFAVPLMKYEIGLELDEDYFIFFR